MNDWEYVIKLDGDLTFEPDYFERCFDEFSKDAKLGIGGGVLYQSADDQITIETNQNFHARR